MEPPPIMWDWLLLWKICHPQFIWAYIAIGLPLRILMARRYSAVWVNRIWLASSTASALFVFCTPFAALPAFAVVFLVAGRDAIYSLFMAVPIAVSTGAAGALVDATLFRVLLRRTVNRNTFLMLFGMNALNISLAVGAVLALIRVHGLHVIAVLGCC